MTIGTRSVLYGAHCFFIHPFFVAWAWWKLYGFPFDPRLWVAFFVHDLGYLGKPNIDGPEGIEHPDLGSRIIRWLFDWEVYKRGPRWIAVPLNAIHFRTWARARSICYRFGENWFSLCRYHSRSFAEREGRLRPSALCYADKLATCLEPRWLYMLRVRATGEVDEYVERFGETHPNVPTAERREEWFRRMRANFYAAAMKAPGKRWIR